MSDEHGGHDDHGGLRHYVRVWVILCILLVISIVGPMFEIRVVTMITAFGIAVVKALMVVRNFMHLPLERRFVTYIVSTCLVFMFLLYAAVAPDVMKATGTNWEKPDWIAEEAAYAAGELTEDDGHGDDDHGEADASH